MKALSASIIVFAGVALILGSTLFRAVWFYGLNIMLVVMGIGCVVGVIGLAGWSAAFKDPDKKTGTAP